MKRRDFFKKLWVGSIIALIVPKALTKKETQSFYLNTQESNAINYRVKYDKELNFTIERSTDGINYTKIGETNNNYFIVP
jgi:hypothetical protein